LRDLELIPILPERQAGRFRNGLPPSSSPLESLMRRFRLSPTLASRLLAGFLLTLGSAPLTAQADASDRPLCEHTQLSHQPGVCASCWFG